MRRFAPIAFVGIAVLAVTVALAARQEATQGDAPRPALVTVDGTDLRVDGFEGATELFFVARWCPSCQRELGAVRRRATGVQRDGYRVVLVGVAERQTKDEFVAWAREHGFRGALVYDATGAIEAAYGAKALPWFVVIGPAGSLLHSADAAPSPEDVRRWARP